MKKRSQREEKERCKQKEDQSVESGKGDGKGGAGEAGGGGGGGGRGGRARAREGEEVSSMKSEGGAGESSVIQPYNNRRYFPTPYQPRREVLFSPFQILLGVSSQGLGSHHRAERNTPSHEGVLHLFYPVHVWQKQKRKRRN